MEPLSISQPIELYDLILEQTVISFEAGLEEEPLFNPSYELIINDLNNHGIKIPEAAKDLYENKLVVFPTDKKFGLAFYDFYYPSTLAGAGYHYIWRSIVQNE